MQRPWANNLTKLQGFTVLWISQCFRNSHSPRSLPKVRPPEHNSTHRMQLAEVLSLIQTQKVMNTVDSRKKKTYKTYMSTLYVQRYACLLAMKSSTSESYTTCIYAHDAMCVM